MSKMHWKSRRTAIAFISLIILYLLIRLQNYEHQTFVFLPKIKPNEAWEFVADFSNMKQLNPTIEHFNIIDESGNYDHWKYSTEYWEHLSHWPHLKNYAVAYFNVKSLKSKSSNTEIFIIDSVHQTCFIFGLFCVKSESEFKFTPNNKSEGTLCQETIIYQCPALLSSFCHREVAYQRKEITTNLKKHFIKNTRMLQTST